MLGGLDKVKLEAARLEVEMNEASWKSDPVNINALRTVAFRTFRVEKPYFMNGHSVHTVEEYLRAMGKVLYIDRIRRRRVGGNPVAADDGAPGGYGGGVRPKGVSDSEYRAAWPGGG